MFWMLRVALLVVIVVPDVRAATTRGGFAFLVAPATDGVQKLSSHHVVSNAR